MLCTFIPHHCTTIFATFLNFDLYCSSRTHSFKKMMVFHQSLPEQKMSSFLKNSQKIFFAFFSSCYAPDLKLKIKLDEVPGVAQVTHSYSCHLPTRGLKILFQLKYQTLPWNFKKFKIKFKTGFLTKFQPIWSSRLAGYC